MKEQKAGIIASNIKSINSLVVEGRWHDAEVYSFDDLAMNQIIVNVGSGDILIINKITGVEVECNTGADSKKENGYLYMPIEAVKSDGSVGVINYAQHTVIALVGLVGTDIDSLIDSKSYVVNHINNCPWDNRLVNLEFVNTRDNTSHGKIIACLAENFSYAIDKKSNLSGKTWNTLKKPISVADMHEFSGYVGDKDYLYCKYTEDIELRRVEHFLSWLMRGERIV